MKLIDLSGTANRYQVTFAHIERLSDERGLFEHADGTRRRTAHGYCVDDNARLLVLASREHGEEALQFATSALNLVLSAQDSVGRFSNRLSMSRFWTDKATTEDCWGRAVWGLGVAAAINDDENIRSRSLAGFQLAITQRSVDVRAMAFAALGAAELHLHDPSPTTAALLSDAITVVGSNALLPGAKFPTDPAWVWPEQQLRYANATLAEALIAAGQAVDRDDAVTVGLAMLGWLLKTENRNGHLSVVGVAGRFAPDRSPHAATPSSGPQFDQQPIEVAAMADACFRAYVVTGNKVWADGVTLAANWFHGANDIGLPMFDIVSGGGYDGLHADRVNLNQGAESTLAYISTMQRVVQIAGNAGLQVQPAVIS